MSCWFVFLLGRIYSSGNMCSLYGCLAQSCTWCGTRPRQVIAFLNGTCILPWFSSLPWLLLQCRHIVGCIIGPDIWNFTTPHYLVCSHDHRLIYLKMLSWGLIADRSWVLFSSVPYKRNWYDVYNERLRTGQYSSSIACLVPSCSQVSNRLCFNNDAIHK